MNSKLHEQTLDVKAPISSYDLFRLCLSVSKAYEVVHSYNQKCSSIQKKKEKQPKNYYQNTVLQKIHTQTEKDVFKKFLILHGAFSIIGYLLEMVLLSILTSMLGDGFSYSLSIFNSFFWFEIIKIIFLYAYIGNKSKNAGGNKAKSDPDNSMLIVFGVLGALALTFIGSYFKATRSFYYDLCLDYEEQTLATLYVIFRLISRFVADILPILISAFIPNFKFKKLYAKTLKKNSEKADARKELHDAKRNDAEHNKLIQEHQQENLSELKKEYNQYKELLEKQKPLCNLMLDIVHSTKAYEIISEENTRIKEASIMHQICQHIQFSDNNLYEPIYILMQARDTYERKYEEQMRNLGSAYHT